jgi:diguanylate cyclase (GGDEF)-like protein
LATKETRTYRLFIFYVGVVICLALSGIFIGTALQTKRLINDEILAEARAYFKHILITRKWNSDYGGVYVEKKEGMKSNPYLKDPDITAVDGTVYTKKNPALMTREISGHAKKKGLFTFNITSLKLINPNNVPDAFETRALRLFEGGKIEVYETEEISERKHFRYMAPLYIDESCLQCHEEQGYNVGDIRGGISVTFDIESIQYRLSKNLYTILFLGIASMALLLGIVYLIERNLIRKLAKARKKIELAAMTDELTGIFNRRHVMKRFKEEFGRANRMGDNLGCILIDIDHFKRINDTYGHLVGDRVLQDVAKHLQGSIRTYDILGRYGGEEFLVVLPDTDCDHAATLTERIRESMKSGVIIETDTKKEIHISVTISAGVPGRLKEDRSVDNIIKRADDALYGAKQAGRDRVTCA